MAISSALKTEHESEMGRIVTFPVKIGKSLAIRKITAIGEDEIRMRT